MTRDTNQRRRALLTLSLASFVGMLAVASRSPVDAVSPAGPERQSDVAMFRAVATRIPTDGYYAAMGAELRERSYPTRSVFNWRTPLLLTTLSSASNVGRVIAVAAAMALAFATMRLTPLPVAIAGGVLQLGTVALLAVPGAIYLGEVPGGVLIGLSACAYIRQSSVTGAALGAAALFVRELAAPYCAACGIIAIVRNRRPELGVWFLAGGVYALYFWYHASQVWAHQLPGDAPHGEPWLQFGGLHFLLSLLAMHSWILFVPATSVVALMLLTCAVIGGSAPVHIRGGVGAFLLFFGMVGQSFNTYWGYVAWPLWAIGCGYGLSEAISCARTLLRLAPAER